ncbi:PREDICTED: UDP-GlcNAc:betaGal beta-1,3-N-acetylglucosaminyltransferase-like protein 1 isoform X1 [Branchiostoma belcheri]|uniref:UDP-GlcNAc:betaGal beta-1,3-N-acetylglucosaminyltransferase-like protein 1 isoform X1 n=1 Tax=Branchiostoma belcheri TaxID=7741 RepID=A0A6P4YDL9_BRABE|nr:PREDICTED: UDP-GlcNAc:betaGal beta-1,3-N-acetylglucosaminyltransferase-like protein 1 isoform X1 [Branchiostoma belcheri]
MPVHNAAAWLQESLQSVLLQTFRGCMEMVVFNDASKDSSLQIIEDWRQKFESAGILMTVGGHDSDSPRGVGYAKNQAILQSSGAYLCFLDADDVMHPRRVELQYETAVRHQSAIVGCRVHREPDGSTDRYTRWINTLTPEQLTTQIYTANGPTVIMPTWFCSRLVWDRVGGFNEGGKVAAFCDVDVKKIEKGFYTYEESRELPKPRVPIIHFKEASPPFVICVKLDLTGGQFEKNLASLNLREGVDYFLFS